MKLINGLTGIILMLFVVACQTTKQNERQVLTPGDSHLITQGRLVLDQGLWRFGYPGVEINGRAQAKEMGVVMRSSTGQSWMGITADEGPLKKIKLSQQWQYYPLLQSDGKQAHQFKLIHLTESWQGSVDIKEFIILQGQVLNLPWAAQSNMLFLGDSVTCGEAIDRQPDHIKNSEWWNITESYGALMARHFNAAAHFVCWGGRGLVRNWNNKLDEPNLNDFYAVALETDKERILWNAQRYVPDAIFIAIGTNDFASGIPDEMGFIEAYIDFLQTLRSQYPKAAMVMTEGAILNGEAKSTLISYLKKVQKKSKDPLIYYVASPHFPGDQMDFHPNKQQHQQLAKAYIQAMSAFKLGPFLN